jgi:preprotein translocase subunit SecG
MLYYLLNTLYIFVCFVLLLVILLQQGKGGDMASAFGGSGSQTAFGARSGATMLSKLTTVFAVLFMLGALALAILGERGGSGTSVVSGSAPPAAPASSAPAPAAPSSTPAPASTPAQPSAPAPAPSTPSPAPK